MRRRNSGRAREVDDLPDQLLARVVARVGLAGEDDLHRPVRVVEEALRGAPGRAGAGWRACRWRSGGRSRWSAPRGRAPRSAALDLRRGRRRARCSCCAQPPRGRRPTSRSRAALVRAPQLGVGDLLDALPQRSCRPAPRAQRGPEVAVVERAHVGARSRTAGVDAVGDVRDRDLVQRARPARRRCHISRETSPCSRLTPLRVAAQCGGPARSC